MKKLVSLLLAIAMLCGVALAEAAPAGEEHDRWLPVYTYSGETPLPSYMNTESYFPIVKEGEDVTVTLGLVYNDTYTNPEAVESMWFFTWLSKFTGIHFEFNLIPKSALNERKALVFLDGNLPDILMGYELSTSELVTYGDVDGALLDMAPYINNDIAPAIVRLFEEVPVAKGDVTTPSGAIYTLPRMYNELNANAYTSSELLFVNTNWLHDVGLEKAPTTLDDFTAMLYAMKAAHPDGIPLLASDGQQDVRSYILNALGYLTDTDNDTGSHPALRNGEVVIPAYTETFKEFLRIMNEYYVNGLIPQDYFSLDTTAENALIEAGNYGVTNRSGIGNVNTSVEFCHQFWTGYPLTSAWNDVQQVPKYTETSKIGGVAISANTQYPELCVRLLDFWFTELGSVYMWEGPAYGSSDTLGMILGHDVTSDWVITYHDLISKGGTYESAYFYVYNQTNPTGQVFGNRAGSRFRPEEITEFRQISIELSGNEVTPLQLREDNVDNWFKMAKIEGFFPYFVEGFPTYVYLDEDTSLRLADLKSVIDPFIDSEVAKFITGINSLDQFDEFEQQLKRLGIEDYLQIYADFYADYVANK